MNPVAAATPAPQGTRPQDERQQLREAAEAFESLYVQMLLQRMRDAQLEEGFFGKGTGSSVYEGMFEQFMSQGLTKNSPLGIASMLLEQWTGDPDGGMQASEALRQVRAARAGQAYEASVVAAPGGSVEPPGGAVDPAIGPDRATTVSRSGRISRPYGWGTDPIDGSHRFHGGVDLPAPRGTAVLAVAPGRVESVEKLPGYGLQVIVRHAEGWSTRYAHLSGTEVRRGQWLVRGQELGKVGNSGRSTGPHLHFEALRGGRKVDPEIAAPGPIRSQVLGSAADVNYERTERFTSRKG